MEKIKYFIKTNIPTIVFVFGVLLIWFLYTINEKPIIYGDLQRIKIPKEEKLLSVTKNGDKLLILTQNRKTRILFFVDHEVVAKKVLITVN